MDKQPINQDIEWRATNELRFRPYNILQQKFEKYKKYVVLDRIQIGERFTIEPTGETEWRDVPTVIE